MWLKYRLTRYGGDFNEAISQVTGAACVQGYQKISAIGDLAWQLMRTASIPTTPRNYEILFTVCASDKPALSRRVASLLHSGASITPGILDDLYREFFEIPSDLAVAREISTGLHTVANTVLRDMGDGQRVLVSLDQALSAVPETLDGPTDVETVRRASATVGDASRLAGVRLGKLETQLADAMASIHALQERLTAAEQAALIDALTGLANRRNFDATLLRHTMQADARKSALSLLLLDIDHFKRFNDTYGHPVGDRVLRLFAHVLRSQIGPADTAARYGGEEFAVITPDSDIHKAAQLAEKIRSTLADQPVINRSSGESFGIVTCSIGVALFVPGERTGDLVDRADRALYRAKNEGRNTVRIDAA
jgi:diguanylate cyclase